MDHAICAVMTLGLFPLGLPNPSWNICVLHDTLNNNETKRSTTTWLCGDYIANKKKLPPLPFKKDKKNLYAAKTLQTN